MAAWSNIKGKIQLQSKGFKSYQLSSKVRSHECIHVDTRSRLKDCRVHCVMSSNISTSDIRIEKQCMGWQFSQVIIYIMRNKTGAW